jgi:hypothetical protein
METNGRCQNVIDSTSTAQKVVPQVTEQEAIQIEKARKVMLALLRAVTNLKFYISNNPLVIRSKTETHDLMTQFLETWDSMRLEITGTEILYKGESLCQKSDDKSQNLAFLFYRDGLRTITFHRGVSHEEIGRLIETICQAMRSPEDETDIVSSLWNADFSNVTYVAVEPFSEMDREGADLPKIEEGECRRMQGNAYENAKRLERAISPPPSEASTIRERTGPSPLLGTLDSEEVKEKVQQMVQFSPITALGNILLDLLSLEEGIEERHHIVNLTEEYLKELVSQRRYGQASETLSKIRLTLRYLASSDDRYKELLDGLLTEVAAYMMTNEEKRNVKDAFAQDPIGVLSLIEGVGPGVLGLLVELVPLAKDAEGKASIRTVLLNLASGDLYRLKSIIGSPDPLIVREAVAVLGKIGNPRGVALLKPCLKHKDVAVRTQVLHALEKMESPQASRLVFEFLQDDDLNMRILAARTLDVSKSKLLEEELCAIISDRTFRHRPKTERMALIEALKKASPKEICRLLGPLFRRRLFRRREEECVMITALRTLASTGTEAARKLLEKGAKSRRKAVAMESLRLLQQPTEGS